MVPSSLLSYPWVLQEGVAVEIAEAVIGALQGELAATAVNAPMVPAEVGAPNERRSIWREWGIQPWRLAWAVPASHSPKSHRDPLPALARQHGFPCRLIRTRRCCGRC